VEVIPNGDKIKYPELYFHACVNYVVLCSSPVFVAMSPLLGWVASCFVPRVLSRVRWSFLGLWMLCNNVLYIHCYSVRDY